MNPRSIVAVAGVALFTLSTAAPALASSNAKATANFHAGSGSYLVKKNGTDGLRKVDGTVTFTQPKAGGTITLSGKLSGLKKNTLYVSVIYKDGKCLPTPGITAFPSGSFRTDKKGKVTIPKGVTVNPAAINPAGVVNVPDAHSISVREVILTPVAIPGPLPGYPDGVPAGTPIAPAQTPTVPNVAAVETCDTTINVR